MMTQPHRYSILTEPEASPPRAPFQLSRSSHVNGDPVQLASGESEGGWTCLIYCYVIYMRKLKSQPWSEIDLLNNILFFLPGPALYACIAMNTQNSNEKKVSSSFK